MRLIAESLAHSFGRRVLLGGVSLEVRQGESIAIVGPSGSGKSTLLAILGGLLPPDAGAVRVVDEDGAERRGRHASWVPQNARLFGGRTVLDNIALGARVGCDSWQEARERARTVLAEINLGGLSEATARTISGGEAQRAAVARALVSDSPFLLADEPTGQLDRTTTQEIARVLLGEGSRRHGVVVVTHDLDLAGQCDRVLHLRDGRLET